MFSIDRFPYDANDEGDDDDDESDDDDDEGDVDDDYYETATKKSGDQC